MTLVLILSVLGLVLLVCGFFVAASLRRVETQTPQERAGAQGEAAVSAVIRSVLREGDTLYNNVPVEFGGKAAELDNVVVNEFGVFIIEAKNYSGVLAGGEDDYEWEQQKLTDAGNWYTNSVKNPIRQVRRQVYIFANYLKYYGVDVWVEGYAYLVYSNSPVESPHILRTTEDIDRAIHRPGRRLDPKVLASIDFLLKN